MPEGRVREHFLDQPFKLLESHLTTEVPQTLKLASAFASQLRLGDTIALSGDLGAGKTHFVQGAATGLGYTEIAHSPSYALVHEYPARYPIFHLDLYRLESGADWNEIGLNEYLGERGIAFIEWPERLPPQTRIGYWIRIQIQNLEADDSARLIEIFKREG